MKITSFVKRYPLPVSQGSIQSSAPARRGASTHLRLWRWIALSVVGIVAIRAGATYRAYSHDLYVMRERVSTGSQIVQTRYGPMEYSVEGDGPPVLVVHGAGGGYDQGILIAHAYGGGGFRWIVPSRFGYLRTPLPADASTTARPCECALRSDASS